MAKFILMKYPQSVLDTTPLNSPMPSDVSAGSTPRGRDVARLVAEGISSRFSGKYTVWSGNAQRCTEPARIIADTLGVDVRTDERLDERRIITERVQLTVAEFRQRQERGYLTPDRREAGDAESPLAHRLRVESWLSDVMGDLRDEDVHLVVSHGGVIEHLHSALSWKPAGAMGASFTFCAPGHLHLWSDVVLPDLRRIWCCLGANLNLIDGDTMAAQVRGIDDLQDLAVDLASDPRFQGLTDAASQHAPGLTFPDKYYIR